jgi:hypothetical protein
MQPLPHTCICSQAQIDLSCTNDCLSQASQSSIERVLIESYDDLITKENDELNKRLKGKGAKFFQFLIFPLNHLSWRKGGLLNKELKL